MKRAFYFTLIFMLLTWQACADIFYFETGAYFKEQDMKWVGQLESFDADTGILTFRYMNHGLPVKIEVHVTRIYSITFDTLESVDRDFPRTRRQLTEPLPSQLTARDQLVELENRGFLGDDIPDEVRVNPNRDSPRLSVRGSLVTLDEQVATLSAWNTEGSFSDFVVSSFALRSWIRGR